MIPFTCAAPISNPPRAGYESEEGFSWNEISKRNEKKEQAPAKGTEGRKKDTKRKDPVGKGENYYKKTLFVELASAVKKPVPEEKVVEKKKDEEPVKEEKENKGMIFFLRFNVLIIQYQPLQRILRSHLLKSKLRVPLDQSTSSSKISQIFHSLNLP